MKYRSRSPYWLQAKYASKCTCDQVIAKGDTIYYYPASRQAVCEACGLKGASAIADELAYAHQGNPY